MLYGIIAAILIICGSSLIGYGIQKEKFWLVGASIGSIVVGITLGLISLATIPM